MGPGVALLWHGGGYQACPQIHVKRVFFYGQARNVRNVNRVSNSYKIDIKGYVLGDLSTYLG